MPFPIRSWMVIKKTDDGFLRAANSNADVLVLDMEDAVAFSEKAKYREIYRQILTSGIFDSRPLFVRINGIENRDEMFQDISQLSLPQVHGFFIPKVENGETVATVAQRLAEEKALQGSDMCNQFLAPIIETSKGFSKLFEIAESSEKLCALSFGNQDFSAENMTTLCTQNSQTSVDEALITQTVIAARSAGVETVSSISSLLGSTASEKFYRRMKRNGCAGAVTLTPAQVMVANREFASSVEELQWARKVANKMTPIASYQRTSHHQPFMIGPPHKKLADELLKRNEIIESKRKEEIQKSANGPTIAAKRAVPEFPTVASTGNVINNNFYRTVRESWITQWTGNFLNTNPIYASDKLAKDLGLESSLIPPMLMTTLAITMPVTMDRSSENSRVHLGIYNARPLRPIYCGDTLTGYCRVTKMRNVPQIGEPKYTIVSTRHLLVNEKNEPVFSVDKNTMVDPQEISEPSDAEKQLEKQEHNAAVNFRSHMLENWAKNPDVNKLRDAQTPLRAGQILLHDHVKAFSNSDHRMLCTYLRATNPHHHNTIKYLERDILVGGPLVVTSTASNSDRDFGHIIHEELIEGYNTTRVNIGEQISTITFVKSIHPLKVEGMDFEDVELVQFGVKALDPGDIEDLPIPVKLFDDSLSKPSELEDFCLEHCDLLLGRLACKLKRRIVRQALH